LISFHDQRDLTLIQQANLLRPAYMLHDNSKYVKVDIGFQCDVYQKLVLSSWQVNPQFASRYNF